MINIFVGLPAMGKTYVLTRKALDFVRQGRHIYTNYDLSLKENSLFYPYKEQIHFWETTDELTGINEGVIIMDEAQVYFNSRAWADADVRLQYKLQQHRKDGLDIFGTVQHEKRLDTVMRELVSHYYQCNKFFSSRENARKVFGIIRVSVYYPEEIQKVKREKAWGEWYLIRKKYVDLYDTNKKIETKEEFKPLKHTEYFCKICDKKEIKHTIR